MSVSDTTIPGTRQAKESRATAWGFTGLLVLLTIVNWADKAILGIVAQPLSEEFGLSASQVGMAGSLFFLAFAIASWFSGFLKKWLSLKWGLGLLALCWAVSMVPMLVVPAFGVLLVSRVLLGLSEGPTGALVFSALYSWHPPEKRGLPSASLNVGTTVAQVSVAPVMALMVAAWGWRAAFLLLAVVGLAWSILWLLVWRGGPYYRETRPEAALDQAADAAPTDKATWIKIFTSHTFLGATAAVIAMYVLLSVIVTWLPSYFEVGLGYTRKQAGLMIGLPSLASLIFALLSTFAGDRMLGRGTSSRMARGVMPGAGLLVAGLAFAVLPYAGAPALAVAVVSVGYGLASIVLPNYLAAMSQLCPPQYLAGALGCFMGAMYLGGLVGPLLTGAIVDGFGDPAAGYAFAFQIFGVVALVASIAALLMVNPERDVERVTG
ncbi:MFS transporter [Streptomyces sp. JNUCC 63]